MSFELLGFKSLGEVVPLALDATVALDASIGLVLPEIQAKITGMIDLQAQLTLNPPSLVTSLNALLDLAAQFQAAIALGLPSASLDLTAVATALAELNLLLGQLNAQIALSLGFKATLGSPGVALYRYSGSLEPLAGQLQGGNPFPGVTPLPLGVFAVAQDLCAVEALRKVFGI